MPTDVKQVRTLMGVVNHYHANLVFIRLTRFSGRGLSLYLRPLRKVGARNPAGASDPDDPGFLRLGHCG